MWTENSIPPQHPVPLSYYENRLQSNSTHVPKCNKQLQQDMLKEAACPLLSRFTDSYFGSKVTISSPVKNKPIYNTAVPLKDTII